MKDPGEFHFKPGKEPKAKRCPFCLKKQDAPIWFEYNGGGPPPSYMVNCGWCGAQGPHGHGKVGGDHEGAKRDAIRLWNKRASFLSRD